MMMMMMIKTCSPLLCHLELPAEEGEQFHGHLSAFFLSFTLHI